MDDSKPSELSSVPPEKATPAMLSEVAKAVRENIAATEALVDSHEELSAQFSGVRKAVTDGLASVDRRLGHQSTDFQRMSDRLSELTKTVKQVATLLTDIRKDQKKERERVNGRLSENERDIGVLSAEVAALTKRGTPANGPAAGDPS